MKAINRAIDKFCMRHPRFGIPHLIQIVTFGSALLVLVGQMDRSGALYSALVLDPSLVMRGQVWRLFTGGFALFAKPINISADGSITLLFRALLLYLFYHLSNGVQGVWGSAKFNVFYLGGLLIEGVITMIYHLLMLIPPIAVWIANALVVQEQLPTLAILGQLLYYLRFIGMSEFVLPVFIVYALMFSESVFRIFFIIPVRVTWLMYAAMIYKVLEILAMPFPLHLIPFASMLIVVVMCAEPLGYMVRNFFRKLRRYFANPEPTRNRNGGSFTDSVKNAEPFAERRCAVCWKSASEYPNLEFRYCSRCEGMHCFCEEHINSHVHFTK
ncbi:MAG: hypothetical protein LBC65_02740 [Oscillospiraceae bacterium]|nr:hypothetical protein [Oscillospiraceae bacterium]